MDKDILGQIKARYLATTRGEWFADSRHPFSVFSQGVALEYRRHPTVVAIANGDTCREREANARFIAAAKTDIPCLVNEVERLTEEIERIQAASGPAHPLWMSPMTTPSPWRIGTCAALVSDHHVGHGAADCPDVPHYGGHLIMEGGLPGDLHLASAAPDMRDALEFAFQALARQGEARDTLLNAFMGKASRAMAKASGGHP